MARPLLADPELPNKSATGREAEINTCIACNQACLDRIFSGKNASCLVNPRAGRETELLLTPAKAPRRVCVIGAGPGGLACAVSLAERGHHVSLYEQEREIGGQFRYAREVPGKEEFHETLRYYRHRIEDTGVNLQLGVRASAESLRGYDGVILATGVTPRGLSIPGADRANVLSYLDVILHGRPVGKRVAIVGAGGIGFDVAEFLSQYVPSPTTDVARWSHEWGVDRDYASRGGLAKPVPEASPREIWLLQRTPGALGKRLNKTTGWVHRAALKMKNVQMLGGVGYERIDDAGLHIVVDGNPQVLNVDNVVVCAGQEPRRDLFDALQAANVPVHLIGGADVAAELDAKRAIAQGTRLAAQL